MFSFCSSCTHRWSNHIHIFLFCFIFSYSISINKSHHIIDYMLYNVQCYPITIAWLCRYFSSAISRNNALKCIQILMIHRRHHHHHSHHHGLFEWMRIKFHSIHFQCTSITTLKLHVMWNCVKYNTIFIDKFISRVTRERSTHSCFCFCWKKWIFFCKRGNTILFLFFPFSVSLDFFGDNIWYRQLRHCFRFRFSRSILEFQWLQQTRLWFRVKCFSSSMFVCQ